MRLGRRPGNPQTRAQIAAAAWELFMAHGYRETSLRAVARAAGCDPKLLHHYFGSKQQLFVEAMQVGVDAAKMVSFILDGGRAGVGGRFIAALTAVYESPTGEKLAELLRSDPKLLHVFWTMIATRLDEVGGALLAERRSVRDRQLAQLQAVVAGLIHTRYVDATHPATALSRQEVISTFGALVEGILAESGRMGR